MMYEVVTKSILFSSIGILLTYLPLRSIHFFITPFIKIRPSFREQVRKILNSFLIEKDTHRYAYLEYRDMEYDLILNIEGKRYLLKQFKYDSQPEILLRYIYKYPEQDISKESIVAKTDLPASASLSDLVTKIELSGELRTMFIKVSKNTIYFSKNVTYEQIWNSSIDKKQLNSTLKSLIKL